MDLRKHSRLLGKELNNLLADIEKGIGIEVSELPPKQLIPIGARFLLKESGVTKEYIKLNDGDIICWAEWKRTSRKSTSKIRILFNGI
jgi:hypothetical protein